MIVDGQKLIRRIKDNRIEAGARKFLVILQNKNHLQKLLHWQLILFFYEVIANYLASIFSFARYCYCLECC